MSNAIRVTPYLFVPFSRANGADHQHASYGFVVADDSVTGYYDGYASAEELAEALEPENILGAVFDDAGWDTMAEWDGLVVDGVAFDDDAYRRARHSRYCRTGTYVTDCDDCAPDGEDL